MKNKSETSHHLVAVDITSDPRVAEAKKLLQDVVRSHQKKLTGIRPPDPVLKQRYEELLADFGERRAGKLWFPFLGSGAGNGALVELLDGSVKYDFISGIGPHFFGHSNSDLISASVDAAISDTVMQGNLQQNRDSLDLCRLLCDSSGMAHCFLTSSGAMANENALKIAFQKKFPANRVLAFEGCFAGRTLALSQMTDKPSYREGLPPNIAVDYVPFFDPNNPVESTERAVAVLKRHMSRYPKQHAAMCFELVQGERGFFVGDTHFFKTLMQLLKDNHVAIWIDEVQTFARTPQLFAFQYFGVEEYVDIVTIGKVAQVGATLFRDDFRPRPGLLSQTFTSSTAAIHAAKAILQELMRGSYFGSQGKIAQLYKYFEKKLQLLEKKHPGLIHGPFGIGSMIAFTLYDGDMPRTTKFVHALFDAGVMTFIAGGTPTRVRFLPPVGVVTLEDIDAVISIVENVLCL